jgi:predicted O-methyltransferase YrrM
MPVSLDNAALAVARAAKGFMPDDEGLALAHAVAAAAAAHPGLPLLEVGTYCGKSAAYVGAALVALPTKPTLFTVDHHRGSEENQPGWEHHDPSVVDPRTGRTDTLPWFRRTIEEAGLEDVVIGIVGPSATVARHWSTPLALLFIDGGHGAEVEWADYRNWSPKVAVGGTLAIHDVFADPADGGRPPYEIYCEARASGAFVEDEAAGCGSLRILRRTAPAETAPAETPTAPVSPGPSPG